MVGLHPGTPCTSFVLLAERPRLVSPSCISPAVREEPQWATHPGSSTQRRLVGAMGVRLTVILPGGPG